MFTSKKNTILIPLVVITIFLFQCQKVEISNGPSLTQAVAVLQPTEGNDITGYILFHENAIEVVTIDVKLWRLKPGLHGFHIHTFGDLRDDAGKSAGGHFNPYDKPHGSPENAERHIGDLGNIRAQTDGTVDTSWTDLSIRLSGSNSILGRAVVVHANQDDMVSQPTGNAGARVAVGVIGRANPDWEP